MTSFSSPLPPAQDPGPAATEADTAVWPSPAGTAPDRLQETPLPGDAGLASPGEALNAGPAPKVSPTAAETGRDDAP